jgi:hypothetical protein
MARHGSLTRRDFEQTAQAMADLLAAVQATVSDPALSRLQVKTAVSHQWASCVNTLAQVMARSNTTFDKGRFMALAFAPLEAGEVVTTTAPDRPAP